MRSVVLVHLDLPVGGVLMDPDQALMDMRRAIEEMDRSITPDEYTRATASLRDAAEALDEWLRKGGFLPAAWSGG